MRLRGVADKWVWLTWAIKIGTYADQLATGFLIDSARLQPFTLKHNIYTHCRSGQRHKIAHFMSRTAGDYVIIGFALLQHQPYGFDIISGKAPITGVVEIAKHQHMLPPACDLRQRGSYFSGHKIHPAKRTFMAEQNAG